MISVRGRLPNGGPEVFNDEAPLPFVEAFSCSMPESYRREYSQAESAEHAAVVWRRGDAEVWMEVLGSGEPGTSWVCVVTDDRPGLLALLSAAISAHSLDILNARIYCRTRNHGPDEAVDFFSVRRLRSSPAGVGVEESDLRAIRDTVISLLHGDADIASLKKRASPTARPKAGSGARVYFDARAPDVDLVTVEVDDKPGLLATITSVLYGERLTILRSEVRTRAGRARDEFHVLELDGSRLKAARKRAVVDRVVAAIARK
jgi:UTP:GlnB (protein PII) uridylyltransferase